MVVRLKSCTEQYIFSAIIQHNGKIILCFWSETKLPGWPEKYNYCNHCSILHSRYDRSKITLLVNFAAIFTLSIPVFAEWMKCHPHPCLSGMLHYKVLRTWFVSQLQSLSFCSVLVFSDQPVPYSHTVFENSTTQLRVKAAVLEDAGVYSCVAVNDHGRAVCTACVLVNGKTLVPFFYIIIWQHIQN